MEKKTPAEVKAQAVPAAPLETKTYETHVQGMICRQCEDVICQRLLFTKGVTDAKAAYWKNNVTVEYDPAITSPDAINAVLEKTGYFPVKSSHSGIITDICCALAIPLLYWGLTALHLADIPTVGSGATLWYIFLIGLLTGTHCITMCGGIALSQSASDNIQPTKADRRRGLLSGLSYNGARVLMCTVIGAIFGSIGQAITYTMKTKSIVFTIAGLLIAIIGLRMWGIIPGLRKIPTLLPGKCELPKKAQKIRRPAVVGALTAFMPCAASYAMWLTAMTAPNGLRGALIMLVWALGTVPLLYLFGIFGSLLPQKWAKWTNKVSMVLIITLGIKMLVNGIKMISAM